MGESSGVRVEGLLDPWIALEVGVDDEAVFDVEHVDDAILQNAISELGFGELQYHGVVIVGENVMDLNVECVLGQSA